HLKSFAIVTAETATGRRIDPSDLHGKSAWIDYPGPPGTFPFLSFSHVLRGQFSPAGVRGKIVVVGATDPSLHDVHATSTSGGGEESGPEIQASAIETALRGFPLRSAPAALDILAICLLGLAPVLLGARLRGLWTIVAAVALGMLFALGVQVAFDHGLVMAFTYPIAALAASAIGTLGAHYAFAAVDRRRTRDTFARFVPEQVVNQVLA